MNDHRYKDKKVKVNTPYIKGLATKYINLRTATRFLFTNQEEEQFFLNTGFDSSYIKSLIKGHCVPSVRECIKRDQKLDRYRDIYRSDLGELLMTTYFEEEAEDDRRFKIPFKTISNREIAELPSRGLDAIGYRKLGDKFNVLLGEAKVSEERNNPPQVVHKKSDSIYNQQLEKIKNRNLLLTRLTDFSRKLDNEDALYICIIIAFIEQNRTQDYEIICGCALIRDLKCVNLSEDYGKLRTHADEFKSANIHFVIISFDKPIEETVALFSEEVRRQADA